MSVCDLLTTWPSSMVVQNSVIHGFIPAAHANQYGASLRTGTIFKVDRFEVGQCTNIYKITDYPFVIRYIPTTTVDEVLTAAPVINLHKFMLRKFDHLQAFADTNLELPALVHILLHKSTKNNPLHLYTRLRFFFIFCRCCMPNTVSKVPLLTTSLQLLQLWSVFSLTRKPSSNILYLWFSLIPLFFIFFKKLNKFWLEYIFMLNLLLKI